MLKMESDTSENTEYGETSNPPSPLSDLSPSPTRKSSRHRKSKLEADMMPYTDSSGSSSSTQVKKMKKTPVIKEKSKGKPPATGKVQAKGKAQAKAKAPPKEKAPTQKRHQQKKGHLKKKKTPAKEKAPAASKKKKSAPRTEATAEAFDRRKDFIKSCVDEMDERRMREVLGEMIEKVPGMLFCILNPPEQPPHGSQQGTMHSCKCTNCREMPTAVENVCCGQTPDKCLSNIPDFFILILDQAVLDLAKLYREEIFALLEGKDENRQYRHTAYRQFILWRHRKLGAGNRVPIPSCCVLKIRARYPDRFAQYTGFLPSRLA